MLDLRLHSDYPPAERRRLRRLAREEAPTARLHGEFHSAKPFYVRLRPDLAPAYDPDAYHTGEAMLAMAGHDLGVETVRVRWLIEVSPAQAGAIVEAGQVDTYGLQRLNTATRGSAWGSGSVTLTLPARTDTVAFVAAHEVRHLWQYQAWPDHKLRDADALEDDANQYGKDAVRRFYRAALNYAQAQTNTTHATD
jgi:hypothetical protein